MSIAAVRVSSESGIEERLDHVATSRGLLYTWAARPPGATTCVLICSSVLGDFTSNYHRERAIGRVLSSMGHGAVRFHYAGEGNSQGERRDMTFAALCADASAVRDYARTLGFTEFAVLGTRLGSLVAAVTVARSPSEPLAFWEPIVEPRRFIIEAQRAKRISKVAQDNGGTTSDWRQELAETGMLDLLGYDIYSPLVESLLPLDLIEAIGSQPRPIFIGRFGPNDATRDSLVEALVNRGFSVQHGRFDLTESWWFHSERLADSGDQLIPTTAAWLANALSALR